MKLKKKHHDARERDFMAKATFKPKIDSKTAVLAHQHRIKVAKKLGINPNEVDLNSVDRMEFLRAEGEMNARHKHEDAERQREEKFKREHPFAPNLARRKRSAQREEVGRASVGSINLDGIAKKKAGPKPTPDEIV